MKCHTTQVELKVYANAKKLTDFGEKYKIGHILGSAGFGSAFCCNLIENSEQKRCVKTMPFPTTENEAEMLTVDLPKLLLMDHPHLTRVFDIYEDGSHYYIVQELMEEGSLLDMIKHGQKLTEK